MVEVAPSFDPSGTTAMVGANILFELLCVASDARATITSKSSNRVY